MENKVVKKTFNVEYDLTSDEFRATKMDEISAKCQEVHDENTICKVTTYCVSDQQLVVHTTEDNRSMMGATSVLLAKRPMIEQSFLTMDDDMVSTYEITITKDTTLPDYVTAINVAQAKADEMFEADDSKIPLVTVIDYRWGNPKTVLSASLFTTTDEDGNKVSLIGVSDSGINVLTGDTEEGIKALSALKAAEENRIFIGDIKDGMIITKKIDGVFKIASNASVFKYSSLLDNTVCVNYNKVIVSNVQATMCKHNSLIDDVIVLKHNIISKNDIKINAEIANNKE